MAKTPAIRPQRPRSDDVAGCLALVWVGIGLLFTTALGAVVADHFNLFKHGAPASSARPAATAAIAKPAPPPAGAGGAGLPGGGGGSGGGAAMPAAAESAAFSSSLRLPPPAGTPAWLAYALPPVPHSGPMLAVVIDDMGLDHARSARAIALPGPLTLSFMSYAEDLELQTRAARLNGHELLMHMPMEPVGHDNPGPDALDVALPLAEIDRRLRLNLARFQGFVGINNHMGSKFTAWRPGMEVVMANLRARGLLWLDSRTTPETAGPALAVSYHVPNTQRDVFLDDVPTQSAVHKQLKELEAIAYRRGYAVAIGHPKDATLEELAGWIPGLRRAGLTLVPVTEIVRKPGGAGTSE
jgi:polysaccharide deacetylase 2 family uncharacterized protein YibQ